MQFKAINPASGETLSSHPGLDDDQLEPLLTATACVTPHWASLPLADRAEVLRRCARLLRAQQDALAQLISREMGKLLREAQGEVEKCAQVCDYYAEQGHRFLADEPVELDQGRACIAYQPLGTVLAIMPWNFPLWQVFRFLAPALMAGNTALLKHAPTVPGCALAVETLLQEAGLPEHAFHALLISNVKTQALIADPRVQALAFTGSEMTGRKVAATAGRNLKKCVLELGGSDPFVVLADADLEWTVEQAVAARFSNAGQTCVSAKRFIVVDDIADEFLARFRAAVEALVPGDPLHPETSLAPLARADLRDNLHRQVLTSLEKGADAVTGCREVAGPGWFYQPSILDRVGPGMPAYEEELFGPVAALIRVRDEAEAVRVANDTAYGLGASVWTQDRARGERLARCIEAGTVFVNALVASDVRLPFGGVKASGFGRELSCHGIREFVNIKSLLIR